MYHKTVEFSHSIKHLCINNCWPGRTILYVYFEYEHGQARSSCSLLTSLGFCLSDKKKKNLQQDDALMHVNALKKYWIWSIP